MNNSSSDIRIKCVLLGDQGVGKTSLVHRYILDRYHSFNETTIGASYNAKPIVYNNTTYKLDIWDTAGQERYRSMVPLYYRNANVVFLCIDLSNKYLKESFVYWYDTLKNNRLVILFRNRRWYASIWMCKTCCTCSRLRAQTHTHARTHLHTHTCA